jgi:minor extracellular serine protease Vpr
LATPANPAARGEVVVIYCSGLGRTQPTANVGEAAPSSPPASALAPVTVTIGGRPATVQFAGLTPGLVGLYQVNVVVPADAPAGGTVPVVVTAGGAASASVTMAVR